MSASRDKFKTPTYNSWRGMKDRCLNPRHKFFSYYGGAGITVCDKWMSFKGFVDDMGEAEPGHEIDRIDGTKGYYKENCRWTSKSHNNANRRGWGKSGFKGVYLRPSGRWAAVVHADKRTITLGTFDDPADAAAEFDKAVIELYGEFAMTNARLGILPAVVSK